LRQSGQQIEGAHSAAVGAGKSRGRPPSFFSVRSNAGLQSGLPVSLTDAFQDE